MDKCLLEKSGNKIKTRNSNDFGTNSLGIICKVAALKLGFPIASRGKTGFPKVIDQLFNKTAGLHGNFLRVARGNRWIFRTLRFYGKCRIWLWGLDFWCAGIHDRRRGKTSSAKWCASLEQVDACIGFSSELEEVVHEQAPIVAESKHEENLVGLIGVCFHI